jgi:hypothetical protein
MLALRRDPRARWMLDETHAARLFGKLKLVICAPISGLPEVGFILFARRTSPTHNFARDLAFQGHRHSLDLCADCMAPVPNSGGLLVPHCSL